VVVLGLVLGYAAHCCYGFGVGFFAIILVMGGIVWCGMALFAHLEEPTKEQPSVPTTYDEAPTEPVRTGYREEMPTVEPPPQQQVVREVIKEKETIREIVKIRCAHCRTLYEESLGRCPHCGAPV